MVSAAKLLILAGVVLITVGLLLWGLAKVGFRGLPGDIRFEGDRFKFYFPIASCIVLSLLLTLASWLWRWFSRP